MNQIKFTPPEKDADGKPLRSLFEECVARGIPISSHCSDLYMKRTMESIELLKHYELEKKNATVFTSQIKGEGFWYDVPFAYDPYWDKRKAQAKYRTTPSVGTP